MQGFFLTYLVGGDDFIHPLNGQIPGAEESIVVSGPLQGRRKKEG
jgi:hypothetical protein